MEEKEQIEGYIRQQQANHEETVKFLQEQVQLKERSLMSEMAELERSFQESEHMLKEQLDEKARVVEVTFIFIGRSRILLKGMHYWGRGAGVLLGVLE